MSIDTEIRIKCKQAKDKWTNDQCIELEDLEKKDIQMMHNKIKAMRKGYSSNANTALRGKDGKIIINKENILKRWVEYISDLLNDESRSENKTIWDTDNSLQACSIMKSEIEAAMRKMKNGKATGNDKVCKGMLVVYDKFGTDIS